MRSRVDNILDRSYTTLPVLGQPSSGHTFRLPSDQVHTVSKQLSATILDRPKPKADVFSLLLYETKHVARLACLLQGIT